MRTKTIALAAVGALALTTLGGVAVAVPALQSLATSTTTQDAAPDDIEDDSTAATRLAKRAEKIAEMLAGLVEDGSITQEQADEVATTLAAATPGKGEGGHKGHGGGLGKVLHQGLATAATTLGLEEDALRDRLKAGETLGEVADAEGVDRADLVAALVAEAQEALAERVTAGDLTQERADELSDGLSERITDGLDREGPVGGPGLRGGHGGPRGADSPNDGETDS